METQLKLAAEAVMKAKTLPELDAVTDDLTHFSSEELNRGSSPQINRLRNRISQAQSFINRWQEYFLAGVEENPGRQLEILNDLTRSRSSYRLLAPEFLTSLRDSLLKQQVAKVDQVVESLKPRLAKAKGVDDVQILLEEIQQLQNGLTYSSVPRRKLERVVTTLNYWLQVLSAEASGQSQNLLGQLNNMESNSYNFQADLIDQDWVEAKRRQALANLNPEYQKRVKVLRPLVDEALVASTKQGDLESLHITLETLLNHSNFSGQLRSQINDLRNEVRSLSRLHESLKDQDEALFLKEAGKKLSDSNPWVGFSRSLRQPLLVKGAEQFYGLKLSFKKDQNLHPALRDLASAAAGKNDWKTALSAHQLITRLSPQEVVTSDQQRLAAIQAYLEGMRLKEAGEKDLAMASLQLVLYHDGTGVPRQQAIAALQELRAAR
ncbi:MAG: hypothetical protein HC904_02940 [Blastochloris sp.]|nr:hypothetical protein [Blastochloris sp.]